MSFLVEAMSYGQPAKRKKLNKEAAQKDSNDKFAGLDIFGYQCKIFNDEFMAKYIEEGQHLIPWMGDKTLLIDRYDCRGHLYSRNEFDSESKGYTYSSTISSEDEALERECDKERYLALEADLMEEAYREEEQEKRLELQNDAGCRTVAFDYGEHGSKPGYDGNEEYDPNECLEQDAELPLLRKLGRPAQKTEERRHSYVTTAEPYGMYEKPADLDIPEGIDLPDSQKSHSIIVKTALLISKHGTQMEIVLKAKQAGNPQFDFLNYGNWLNPYYKLILGKIRDKTYKPSETVASASTSSQQTKTLQAQAQTQPDSNTSDDEDDEDDEYLNPILQAHRRPVKTVAKPTPAVLTTNSTDPQPRSNGNDYATLLRGNNHVISSKGSESPTPFRREPTRVKGNAAAVYMARKYENSRQSIGSPKEVTTNEDEANDDDWANELEEDLSYSIVDAQSYQLMASQLDPSQQHASSTFSLMAFVPPPPPPGQEDQHDSGKDFMSMIYPSHLLPPPPPPPGCTDADTASFTDSSPASFAESTIQQQQQHIVPPPPDLKSVVDKLAQYVSRNGEEFEEQVKVKKDPRFDFLKSDNIYYPYYLFKKQHFIIDIATKKAKEQKEKEEKASKPLSFALKLKSKAKAPRKEMKTVEIFKETPDDSESETEEIYNEIDGYRPNKVKNQTEIEAPKEKEPSNEEKARIAMDKAKIMIAEAQRKLKELQKQADFEDIDDPAKSEQDHQMQLERRRKAAAFIGMLKHTTSNEDDSSSSSYNSSDQDDSDESDLSGDEQEHAQPKRHFQERAISPEHDDPLKQSLHQINGDSDADE